MKSKKLLIIGGSGFFAKSILDHILDYNLFKNVKTVLLLSRGFNKILISKNLKKKIKIKIFRADISRLKKIPFADYVIYCAINHNYKEDYKAVYNYFKLAKKYHLKSKILFTSSGAVYGLQPPQVNKIKENYLLKNKRVDFYNHSKNIYSITKLKNEEIFKKLGKFGIKVSIARCFAFVGPNLPLNTNYVIGNIINNILRNENIIIKANYKITRSYMYSDDLVRWLFKILDHADIKCPIYNVGSSNAISIQKIAKILGKKYNLKVNIPKITNKISDYYIPNVNKAKKNIKLKNNYSSLQAVNKTIQLILKKNCNEKR